MPIWAKVAAIVVVSTLLTGSKVIIHVPGGGSGVSPFPMGDIPPAGTETRFEVRSFHATRYYEIEGNTREEVWARLFGATNPLAIDSATGTRPLGHASVRYRYDYQSEYATNPSLCRVKSGNLEFRFETVLPKLAQEQASDQLRNSWQNLQELISEHEAGHHDIYRQLVTRLPRVLAHIGEAPCTELEERVRAKVADAVSVIRQASHEYDENYGAAALFASSR